MLNKIAGYALLIYAPAVFAQTNVPPEPAFGSVGMLVRTNSVLRVVVVATGSPADNAGLRPMDQILKVDGKPTKGLSLAESVAAVRGPTDSIVELLIRRVGIPQPYIVKLTRTRIDPEKVDWKTMYNGISRFMPRSDELFNAEHYLQQTKGTVTSNKTTGVDVP